MHWQGINNYYLFSRKKIEIWRECKKLMIGKNIPQRVKLVFLTFCHIQTCIWLWKPIIVKGKKLRNSVLFVSVQNKVLYNAREITRNLMWCKTNTNHGFTHWFDWLVKTIPIHWLLLIGIVISHHFIEPMRSRRKTKTS